MVSTRSATVAGASETVLVNAQGLTLSYLTSDTIAKLACTASNGCATFWPPLTTTGAARSSSSLSGSLTTFDGSNGHQVAYNGHPVYTFAGDHAPGDANGEGKVSFGGTWHVATPGLAAGAGGSGGPAPSPSSSSPYGY